MQAAGAAPLTAAPSAPSAAEIPIRIADSLSRCPREGSREVAEEAGVGRCWVLGGGGGGGGGGGRIGGGVRGGGGQLDEADEADVMIIEEFEAAEREASEQTPTSPVPVVPPPPACAAPPSLPHRSGTGAKLQVAGGVSGGEGGVREVAGGGELGAEHCPPPLGGGKVVAATRACGSAGAGSRALSRSGAKAPMGVVAGVLRYCCSCKVELCWRCCGRRAEWCSWVLCDRQEGEEGEEKEE